ncbi:distal tail protein Dit [Streptococcus himalayensis]|uniref:Phage tail protein n=1 Tax=Streptococcus himalayensis TaxID=1888195 RepID=A0A917A5H2_9STRE|nr:distal tail protein Dit [Streptococcus himalayensis]QBX25363.1 capsid and scaffold protein [Streptococcus phage Javan254]GGE26260.1 hypothetical protein GCM10011510_04270 [Streptococcus himalayensis]
MTTMTFNKVDMSKYFRITDIIRPIGNSRSITTDDAPDIGVNIQQIKIDAKVITVKFDMKTSTPQEMETLKHELAGVLNVNEPVKILFDDEPDKYYLGIPIDDVTPDSLTRWFQRSEIKFLIPDGVAHSTTYKKLDSFINATVTSEKVVFDITNNGTTPAYPIITVNHDAENGYIGLVNKDSAMELGKREGEQREVYQQSETLFDYRDQRIVTGYSAAQKNVAILNDTVQRLNSTSRIVDNWGRKHIELANRGGTVGNNAVSLTWDIPNDSSGAGGSLNDYIWWRQVFWLGSANQLGFIKLMVSDESGQFLYGVETYKRQYGLECEYNFMATDGKGGYTMLKRWRFTGTHRNDQNPFNEPRGWSDLRRNDDVVTVYWWGGYHRIVIPQIKGRKSAKIHLALGTLGSAPIVTHMYLDSLLYVKDFVTKYRDIPNRYPAGTEVIVNSEVDTVTVNGLSKISDVVHGSEWLAIPPGKSQLECYFSSFVRDKPRIKIEFEERWL